MRYTLLLLLSLSVFASCKKKRQETVTRTTDMVSFKLLNGMGMPIHVAFYANAGDYKNSTNIAHYSDMRSGDTLDLNLPAADYFVDWYTDDYKISAWGSRAMLCDYQFLPNIFKISGYSTAARLFFIKGNRPETGWKAFDVCKNNKSIWNSLDENERYLQLALTKDMAFAYEQHTADGPVTHSGWFTISNSGVAQANLFEQLGDNNVRRVLSAMYHINGMTRFAQMDTLELVVDDKQYVLARKP